MFMPYQISHEQSMDHLSLKHEYLQAYVTIGNLLLHYL